MLGLRPHHEPGNVLHEQQWRLVSIACFDKVGDLFSRFGIDNSAKSWRTTGRIAKHSTRIGYYPYLHPADASMAGDDLARVVCLKLIEVTIVDNAVQQIAHVVRLPVICRNYFVDLLRWSAGIRNRRISAHVPQTARLLTWQFSDELSYLGNRVFIIPDAIMRDTGHLIVGSSAAQSLVINRLSGGAFHQVRAAQAHERCSLDHDDHVRERRQVRATCDTRSHYRGDLRHLQIATHD